MGTAMFNVINNLNTSLNFKVLSHFCAAHLLEVSYLLKEEMETLQVLRSEFYFYAVT